MKTAIVDPIDVALREDIGDGDLTTDFFVPKNQRANARIVTLERAILAGTETAAEVFRRIDSSLDITYSRPSDSVGVVVSSSCTSADQRTSPVIRLSAVKWPSAAET